MIGKLIRAYESGYEDSRISENIFWFGHKFTADNSEYLYPREQWERRRDELRKNYAKMSILEKIAYTLGEDSLSLSLPNKPLAQPI